MPCCATPETVVGNSGPTDPVWIDNDYAFVCFGKKVLRRMPLLPQPSPFIRAWDRHQETQKYASDGWVSEPEPETETLKIKFAEPEPELNP